MKKQNDKGTKLIKNNNFLKNVKIASLLFMLMLVAAFSVGGISLTALNDMKTLNDDMKNLYTDKMLTSLELKHLETEFYTIRLLMAKMVYSNTYDENSAKAISDKKESLVKIFDKYRNFKMSQEQRKIFENIEKNYKAYLDDAEIVIKKLKSGMKASESEISKLIIYATNAQNDINSLVKLNADTAAEAVNKANKEYSNSRTIFIYIFIILTTLFMILFLALSKLIKVSMLQINDVLTKLSQYDFTVNLQEEGKNEFAQMNRSLAIVINNMKNMLKEVKENSENLTSHSQSLAAISEEMAASSQELSNTMQQVSEGATSQAQDLNDIVNIILQLTNNIENVYTELQNVKDETDNTTTKANIGKQEMDKLIKSINEIKSAFEIVIEKVNNLTNSVKEISSITEVISAISEQTNLLALNAAIEAARAGEMGRGFAVVAEEIRKLAEQSGKSTDEIIKLVASINADTDEVINTSKDVEDFIKAQAASVENTVKSFGDILISIENIAPLMDRTYKGMDEIVKSKDMVLERVEEVSAVTEENSAASEEVAASSQELTASSEEVAATAQDLSAMAENLMNAVSLFKV